MSSTFLDRVDTADSGMALHSATGVDAAPRPVVTDHEERQQWVTKALCRGMDPDALFVRGAAQRDATAICRHCPVLLSCRADALDNRVEFGVWGGMTERQRRALLKQYPEVTSWSEFFENQETHQRIAS